MISALRFAGALAAWLLVGIAAALPQTAEEIAKLQQQAQQLFDAGKYAEALVAQRAVATGTEKLETARDGKPGLQTTNALNHVSWSALFARTPGEALNASERAHTLAPASLVIETNRAHALLFLGRSREAGKIYLAHKGKWLRREGRGVQCRSIRFEMPSPMNNAS